jgi:hypothetical protein
MKNLGRNRKIKEYKVILGEKLCGSLQDVVYILHLVKELT